MKNVRAILFDVDGTLLNTTEFILRAFEHALTTFKYVPPDRKTMARRIGEPIADLYHAFSGSREHTKELIQTHTAFQVENHHLSELFPHTLATLKELRARGYKIAAVSTRLKESLNITLKNAGILELFDAVVSGEDAPALKPDPAPLFQALGILGEKPEHAAMVGDSQVDIQAGKNAGTRTVRATYGFHQERMREPEPDYFIDDISELLKIF